MFESAVFYAFAAVLLVSATFVIRRAPGAQRRCSWCSPLHRAGTWLLLRAEFLAIALVVVYVRRGDGAVLFVVMMLDINIEACARALAQLRCDRGGGSWCSR